MQTWSPAHYHLMTKSSRQNESSNDMEKQLEKNIIKCILHIKTFEKAAHSKSLMAVNFSFYPCLFQAPDSQGTHNSKYDITFKIIQ